MTSLLTLVPGFIDFDENGQPLLTVTVKHTAEKKFIVTAMPAFDVEHMIEVLGSWNGRGNSPYVENTEYEVTINGIEVATCKVNKVKIGSDDDPALKKFLMQFRGYLSDLARKLKSIVEALPSVEAIEKVARYGIRRNLLGSLKHEDKDGFIKGTEEIRFISQCELGNRRLAWNPHLVIIMVRSKNSHPFLETVIEIMTRAAQTMISRLVCEEQEKIMSETEKTFEVVRRRFAD